MGAAQWPVLFALSPKDRGVPSDATSTTKIPSYTLVRIIMFWKHLLRCKNKIPVDTVLIWTKSLPATTCLSNFCSYNLEKNIVILYTYTYIISTLSCLLLSPFCCQLLRPFLLFPLHLPPLFCSLIFPLSSPDYSSTVTQPVGGVSCTSQNLKRACIAAQSGRMITLFIITVGS